MLPICVPGTFVEMGWNVPRISFGASGFKSHMSMWLGPPSSMKKIQDFAFAGRSVAASAWSCSSDGSVSPPKRPVLPIRRASRRLIPSQLGRFISK